MPVKSLVKALTRSRTPAVPDGRRIYAVGDIHGRLDLLDRLLDTIAEDQAGRRPAQDELVFLGDLVDRGPDSKGVVERLLQLRRSNPHVRFLMGNHEEVFLRAAAGDARSLRFMLRIGGRETIASYGVTEQEYADLDYGALAQRLGELVPAEHVAFLSGFERWVAAGDYLFVHAGLRPGIPIEEQSEEDLCWIREDFLDHRDSFGKIVVHGHSISEEVEVRSNRIGIDTGAYASGRLTAIGLEGEERWFLST